MPRVRLEPVVWNPPPMPARAHRSRGNRPWPGVRLIPVGGVGPEDVVCDARGRVYTGLEDGRVLRVDPEGEAIETLVDTGGRPLGLEVCPDGTLLVCDSVRGLLRLHPDTGELEVLVSEVAGERLSFASNVVRGRDGTLYFSSSTARFGFDDWMADLMEHSGTGRLCRRTPDGKVEVLLDGLQFANGVALAADESFLLVAQTGAYCVTRLWLSGPRAGQVEPFIENLPGFPDNMARGSDGLFWVTLATPRNPMLDRLHALPPILRRIAYALPHRLHPAPVRTAWVLALDEHGRVVHDLQGPGDAFAMVTGVCEREGMLFFGSLHDAAIAMLPTPRR